MKTAKWLKHQWDRTAAVIACVLGALSLYLGWLGLSDATLPTQQIPYLASGGLFGVFALGIGATLWLSADLRDEWRKLDDLDATLLRLLETLERPEETTTGGGVDKSAPRDNGTSRQRPLRVDV